MSQDIPRPGDGPIPTAPFLPPSTVIPWATLVPPPLPAPGRPRIWPTLLVGIGVIPLATVVAVVALIAYLAAIGELGGLQQPAAAETIVAKCMSTPGGFFAIFLPGQLTFLFVALGAAMLSPQSLRQRLALCRPRLPVWSLPLSALATPLFGFAGGLLMQSLIKEPSSQLKMLASAASEPTGWFAVAVALTFSLVPPLAEETLFRGYLQRRLLDRWGPLAAISISSLLFTAAHMDPGQMLGVLPLSIWLGVIAWQYGSIWPSMLCHVTQNALFVVANRLSGAKEDASLNASVVIILGTSCIFLAGSIYVMFRYRRSPIGATVVK